MKVAILHYWFLLNGGGESVVDALLEIYPDADVFCLMADRNSIPKGLPPDRLHCSPLARFPFANKLNRAIFPLYAGAVSSFDFSGYDLVISSDSPPTKDIVTPVDTIHISYCHTPGRFIWDLAPSFTAGLPWPLRTPFAYMAAQARMSDYVAAQRVSHFVANSQYVHKRIAHYYSRNSTVVYPPVNTGNGYIAESSQDYYLSVGRLVATKRIELLIHACNHLRRRLLIVGTGREEKALKAIAGPTIEFLGRLPDDKLRNIYAECRALLFAANEDFGIVPVEAQAFGRPVIAYGYGGSLETVRVNDGQGLPDTGLFFFKQDVKSAIDGILRFEANEHRFTPRHIRAHSLRFDKSVFISRMRDVVSGQFVQTDYERVIAS